MLGLTLFLFAGFGLGYGVRNFISRRRRARARKRFHDRFGNSSGHPNGSPSTATLPRELKRTNSNESPDSHQTREPADRAQGD